VGIGEWIGAFVTVIGGTAAVVGILGYFTSRIVEHWLDKRLENHKSKLESESERAADALRHRLQMEYLEHEVRFRKLHEVQANAIANVYEALQQFHADFVSYLHPIEMGGESKDEKIPFVNASMCKFRDAFYPRRLYFPEELAKKIHKFSELMIKETNDFTLARKREREGRAPVGGEDYWANAMNAINEQSPELFRQIEDEFRRLMGFREVTQ
jgi:hypothetical protein